MRRRVLPIATAVVIFSSALTGCSAAGSGANSANECRPLLASGALSDSVRVSGDNASSLNIKAAKNVSPLSAQRTVLSSKDGERQAEELVKNGSIFEANLAYLDASSGEILQVSPGYGSGKGQLFLADPQAGTLFEGLLCSAVGDTVAVALTPQESQAMGVRGQLVVVAQIEGVHAPRATGAFKALPTGFPAVTTDDSGRPGLVLPPQSAPTQLKSAARVEGTGSNVRAEDNVVAQVLTVSWDGHEMKNTWDQGPTGLGAEVDVAQSGNTFRSALTGYPVGSQVVVIEPGDGSPRVSVVDILAVA